MGSLPGSFPSVTMTTRSTTRDGAGCCQADGSTSSAAATTVHASACGLTSSVVSWTAGYTTRGASAVGANSMTNRCDAQQRLKPMLGVGGAARFTATGPTLSTWGRMEAVWE